MDHKKAAARRYSFLMEVLNTPIALASLNAAWLENTYLTCSYAYYCKDVSLVPDDWYDALCKHMFERYHEFKDSSLIMKENLAAGTCLGIKYPETTQLIADQIITQIQD